jgi:hypothetical protein
LRVILGAVKRSIYLERTVPQVDNQMDQSGKRSGQRSFARSHAGQAQARAHTAMLLVYVSRYRGRFLVEVDVTRCGRKRRF